jgi:hypothetical protein
MAQVIIAVSMNKECHFAEFPHFFIDMLTSILPIIIMTNVVLLRAEIKFNIVSIIDLLL